MRALSRLVAVVGALAGLACLPACVIGNTIHADGHSVRRGGEAYAEIVPRSGAELTGHATFEELRGGVLVTVVLEDAPPGWHAVHVHETGDCSADDASTAGGHFNPDGSPHGAPHAPEHHAGDLGNLWVDEDGDAYHVVFMPGLAVDRGSHGVVGRALVVHAEPDDLQSQPSGAAGARIGCGVIER